MRSSHLKLSLDELQRLDRAAQITNYSGTVVRCWGNGPPMVLLHGGYGSWNHWCRNIDFLAKHFRVVAPDAPGFGRSLELEPQADLDKYFGRVAAVVGECISDAGRYSLVGFSFGAALALEVALRIDKKPDSLTLLGPAGFGGPAGRIIDIQKLPKQDGGQLSPEVRAVHSHNLSNWMLSSKPEFSDYIIDLHHENILAARFDSRDVSHRDTTVDQLPLINAPVQLIWGGADALVHPSLDYLIQRCRNARSDTKIAVIPEAGHWIQYECPDFVNECLLAFHSSTKKT